MARLSRSLRAAQQDRRSKRPQVRLLASNGNPTTGYRNIDDFYLIFMKSVIDLALKDHVFRGKAESKLDHFLAAEHAMKRLEVAVGTFEEDPPSATFKRGELLLSMATDYFAMLNGTMLEKDLPTREDRELGELGLAAGQGLAGSIRQALSWLQRHFELFDPMTTISDGSNLDILTCEIRELSDGSEFHRVLVFNALNRDHTVQNNKQKRNTAYPSAKEIKARDNDEAGEKDAEDWEDGSTPCGAHTKKDCQQGIRQHRAFINHAMASAGTNVAANSTPTTATLSPSPAIPHRPVPSVVIEKSQGCAMDISGENTEDASDEAAWRRKTDRFGITLVPLDPFHHEATPVPRDPDASDAATIGDTQAGDEEEQTPDVDMPTDVTGNLQLEQAYTIMSKIIDEGHAEEKKVRIAEMEAERSCFEALREANKRKADQKMDGLRSLIDKVNVPRGG